MEPLAMVVADGRVVYTSYVHLGVTMPKAAIFTMKLEPDLRADFMAAAQASHQPASQVVRDLMRDFIHRQQQRRDRTEFLQRKVDDARHAVRDGQGRSNAAVEADFAARRDRTLGQE